MAKTTAKTKSAGTVAVSRLSTEAALHSLVTVLDDVVAADDALAALYIVNAHALIGLLHAGAVGIADPASRYRGALKGTLSWLAGLGAISYPQARQTVLGRLVALFGEYEMAAERLEWKGLPEMVGHPDYDDAPMDRNVPTLPLWPDTPDGHTVDRFHAACYALWWLNVACGHHPASTAADGSTPVALTGPLTWAEGGLPPATTLLTLETFHTDGKTKRHRSIRTLKTLDLGQAIAEAEVFFGRGLDYVILAYSQNNRYVVAERAVDLQAKEQFMAPPPVKHRMKQVQP